MTEQHVIDVNGGAEKFEEKFEEDLEALLKEENQLDKVEPVTRALSDMGTFWKQIVDKLGKDKYCFISGEPIADDEEFDVVMVPHNKVSKGMIAFVSVKKSINTD